MLFRRLSATFQFFGSKLDSKTAKPLFNHEARKRARQILEIAKDGYFSDPPNQCFYEQLHDDKGKPVQDKLGVPIIRCWRGESCTEAIHRALNQNLGRLVRERSRNALPGAFTDS